MIEKIESTDLHRFFDQVGLQIFFADHEKCVGMRFNQGLQKCDVAFRIGFQFDPNKLCIERLISGLVR